MFIILGIDGLSSVQLFEEHTSLPNVQSLLDTGAYTYLSRASVPTTSGINWGSHFFGHGVHYHCWQDNVQPFACTGAQSVFDAVPNSSAYSKWDSFSQHISSFETTASDSETAAKLVQHIRLRNVDFVTGIFDGVDEAVHSGRSASSALQRIDTEIGRVLSNVTALDFVLLVSDHGTRKCRWWQWTCLDHYGTSAREIYTPFILRGPGVSPGPIMRRISAQDTSYFVLTALGRSMPCDWELGKYTSCITSWPGVSTHVKLKEELLRTGIDYVIWIGIAVVSILLMLYIKSGKKATLRKCQ